MPVVVLPAGNNTYTPTPPDANYTVSQTPPSDGNNTVTLGNGTDQVTFADGNNTLTLGDGTDQVNLGNGGNTVTTGNGNSAVTVGNGNNTITAGTGSNTIMLGTGVDIVSTNAGNNTVSVAGSAISADTIHGALSTGDGSTNKLVLTSPGPAMAPVSVYGFQSFQLANGGPNGLTLSEGNFTDLPGGSITVTGGNSGNIVNAAALSAAHSVVIYGGAGTDVFTGGAGNDRFIFAPSDLSGDTVSGGGGIDTLELQAGSSTGKVNGLGGPTFSGLSVVDVDAGADWLFTSTQAVTDTINLAAGATGEFSGAMSSGQTIAFSAATGTLKIDSASQFAGQIVGFQVGDTIDLTTVGFSAAGSAILATGNVLQVAENGQTYNFQLDPNQNFAGEQFTLSADGGSGTNIAVSASNAANPTATMVLDDASTGDYEIYDIGNNTIQSASPLGQIATTWQFAGLGSFNGTDTGDMILRNSSNGMLQIDDIQNNQIVSTTQVGPIGTEWQVAGFGNFSSNPGETDMLMRTSTGMLEFYDIKNNQVVSGTPAGQIGTEWQVSGFGDFSGNAGESDMLMRIPSTGAMEIYDIKNNQIVSGTPLGQVDPAWQILGIGNFSGNTGETDIIMRDTAASNYGGLEEYHIANNQIVSTNPMGGIGLDWQVMGFGNFSGNPGETDMLLRASTGAVGIYDIQNNQIVSGTPAGSIALTWQLGGVANTPLGNLGGTLIG